MQNLNIHTITPSDFQALIPILAELKYPIFLWGDVGIGKSDCIEKYCQSRGWRVTTQILATMLPSDFQLPLINREEGTVEWAVADFLKAQDLEDSDKPHVIFFDEFNAATSDIHAVVLQLLLNRKLNNFKIPENVWFVAAGNQPECNALGMELDSATTDRLIHFKIEPNVAEWLNWATKNNIHASVKAFIKVYPDQLYNSGPPKISQLVKATPRSWERVSEVIKLQEAQGKKIEEISAIIAGIIGLDITTSFYETLKILEKLPDMRWLLSEASDIEVERLAPTSDIEAFSLLYALQGIANTVEEYVRVMSIFKLFTGLKDQNNINRREHYHAALIEMIEQSRFIAAKDGVDGCVRMTLESSIFREYLLPDITSIPRIGDKLDITSLSDFL